MAYNSNLHNMGESYHVSMPLMHQIEFSGMHLPDLPQLTDINLNIRQQCGLSSVHPQSQVHGCPIANSEERMFAERSSTQYKMGLMSKSSQSAPLLPSLPTFVTSSVNQQTNTGSFMHQFHAYQNHMPHSIENSCPNGSLKFMGNNMETPWCKSNIQPNENKKLSEGDPDSLIASYNSSDVGAKSQTKRKRGRKAQKEKNEEKAEKLKRVKYIKPGCTDLCRFHCKEKISQCCREDIFNEYWNLESDTQRKEFISRNAIKMPMMKCKEGSRRSFSVDWAFTLKGESYSVCKLFFLDTLDIPENTAYAAIKDSEFISNDSPIIESRDTKDLLPKTTWFETDLDDFNACFYPKKTRNSERRKKLYTKKDKFTELRPGCSSCRRQCHSKFSLDDRLQIFNTYKNLSNIRKQREFIGKYVVRTERKRIRPGITSRRGCSIEWKLPVNGTPVSVCRTFFLHTLGISERMAYNIGLQKEIQPVERTDKEEKVSMAKEKTKTKTGSSSILVAKGKLKSALNRLSRKQKVKNDYYSDTEEEDYEVVDDDYTYLPSNRNSSVSNKNCKRKRKRKADKTFRICKKSKPASLELDETVEKWTRPELRHRVDATSVFNSKLPIKKRNKERSPMIPVLKIKKERIILTGRKKRKRNPYKRKETPKGNNFPPCQETCRRKCQAMLPPEARKEIFEEFWSLLTMDEQRNFISLLVKKEKRHTCKCLIASKLRETQRGYKIHWSLRHNGQMFSVCKTFFTHVLQISDRVVYRAIKDDAHFESSESQGPCRHFIGQTQAQSLPSEEVEIESCKMEVAYPTVMNVTADESNNEHYGINSSSLAQANNSNISQLKTAQVESSALSQPGVSSVHENEESLGSQNLSPEHSNEFLPEDNNATTAVDESLANIDTNYESLIPSLTAVKDSTSLLHSTSGALSSSQHDPLQYIVPGRGSSNIDPESQQNMVSMGDKSSGPWPKTAFSDNFQYPQGNNLQAFPTFNDLRIDPLAATSFPSHPSHSQPRVPHFPFPLDGRQNTKFNTHGSHFPHHYSSFPYHGPPSGSVNNVPINNDLMEYFHHSGRHGLNIPVPGEVNSSHILQNYSDIGINIGTFEENERQFADPFVLQSVTTAMEIGMTNPSKKIRKRKKKTSTTASFQMKHTKISLKCRKKKEKKPFTRCVKSGCVNTCKRKCAVNIPYEAREKMFRDFWSLENDLKRREFILPNVRKVPKKSCSGVNSRRCCSLEWGLVHEGARHIVCKKFFLDTFDIGEKFVKTVLDKAAKKSGSLEDMRGKTRKKPVQFIVETEEMENHVRSLATLKATQCEMCKKDFTRWCVDNGLSLGQMYRLYAEKRKALGIKPACRSSFTSICAKKFNIKVTPPKDNHCDTCDLLQITNNSGQSEDRSFTDSLN